MAPPSKPLYAKLPNQQLLVPKSSDKYMLFFLDFELNFCYYV